MEKLLMFLVICLFAKAVENRNHTKLVRDVEENERTEPEHNVLQKLPCSSVIDAERDSVASESQCGPPRKVLFDLHDLPRAAHEEVYPKAVWVYQCVGLCDDHGSDFKCKPGKTIIRHIYVKIVDIFSGTETCAAYIVEEPTQCTCCQDSKGEVCKAKGKVLVPHKCACDCPNQEDKRECLDKNMQWDRNICTCQEPETRIAPHSPTTAIFRRKLGAGEEAVGLLESEDSQK